MTGGPLIVFTQKTLVDEILQRLFQVRCESYLLSLNVLQY